MCGIAGFCINKNDHLPRLSDIVDEMLLEIEARGKDSTGLAYVRPDRRAYLHKEAVPAKVYIKNRRRQRRVNGAMLGVMHTRMATQGTPKNPINNHPIYHGNVIGVHNGHIWNDDSIFDLLDVPRNGEVDSEAAFALLDNFDPMEALPEVRGSAALAWFDKREGRGTLHLARVSSSPLAVGQTLGGSFFFASTMGMLERSLFVNGITLNWKLELGEGTYMKVRNGRIESMDSFKPARPLYSAGPIGTSKPKRSVAADLPSRWFNWDGTWLDDDTFVPYN